MKRVVAVVSAFLFAGLSACNEDPGICTVDQNSDGSATIACADGRSARISAPQDGADGAGCGVVDNGDGTFTVTCGEDAPITLTNGAQGESGSSCSVADNGDGTKTISCADGTSVTVEDGAQGMSGEPCTVADNGDGTSSITCSDGSTEEYVSCADGRAVFSNISLNGGSPMLTGPRAIQQYESFEMSFDYEVTGTAGSFGETQKLLVAFRDATLGYVPDTKCIDFGPAPTCSTGGPVSGSSMPVKIATPIQPGMYEIRIFHLDGGSCDEGRSFLADSAADVELGIKVGDITVQERAACTKGQKYITNVRMNGQPGNIITVAPGARFTLTADFSIARGGCSGCIEPWRIGFADEQIVECPFVGVPAECPGSVSRDREFALNAPTTEGTHYIGWRTGLVIRCRDVGFGRFDKRTAFATVLVKEP
ncbi:MAG: hypothetical protein AAGI01_11990 [Myxococcota bacterium]